MYIFLLNLKYLNLLLCNDFVRLQNFDKNLKYNVLIKKVTDKMIPDPFVAREEKAWYPPEDVVRTNFFSSPGTEARTQ